MFNFILYRIFGGVVQSMIGYFVVGVASLKHQQRQFG
ncbi:hypothetical protein Fleli_3245 [Bernardetia litoralis DSM 6794]|uniref:Uncharacterized protein n=1 Tax=Bernardetia litoralis (strain ATCC 23117 / DSM 6794 / NBRC 15988 / NCIMB 1366 / Fx l1 / Sio-4) TaxID=880071 RepID=I4ANP1_BERLS|nr:hypothetical protein Fleli_3245 [Bernardetia litoralis DSM 6794]